VLLLCMPVRALRQRQPANCFRIGHSTHSFFLSVALVSVDRCARWLEVWTLRDRV